MAVDDPVKSHVLEMAVLAAEEAARIDRVLKRGKLPAGVGTGLRPAPARGAVQVIRPEEVARTETGQFRLHRLTDPGAATIRVADAFDVMEEQAARRSRNRADHAPLFTAAQKAAGRAYAEVYTAVAAGAIKGSDWEGASAGGGLGSAMDALVHNAGRLKAMCAALGGLALVPGHLRDRDQRRAITMHALVHRVSVGEETITHVLAHHRWPPKKMSYRLQLREALCAGLDALYGL